MTDMCLRINGLHQATKCYTLLPFQGVFAAINLPRALPWAMGFCPFGACLERPYLNFNGVQASLIRKNDIYNKV